MNFYRRRPLALAITICLLLSAAVAFFTGVLKIILVFVLLIGVPAGILLARRVLGFTPFVTPYIFLTAALTLGCLLTSYAYFDIHAARHERLTDGTIRATVIGIRYENDYSSAYTVRLDSVNGKRYGGKGVLTSMSSLSAEIGDIIEADVAFMPLSDAFSYRSYSKMSAVADGYVFACSADTVEYVGTSGSLEVRLARVRGRISAAMELYLDRDTSAMADALFLGIRDGLGVVGRDFTYMGVTHLLALSGLHIVVLTSAVNKMLSLLRLGKRPRTAVSALFIIGYIALTGFLLSAVRAAIMVLLSYAAAGLGSKNDNVTSLFTAVYLIVLVSPGALWDVGLQMSFLATLGVILMSEATERRIKSGGRKLSRFKGLLSGIAASLGATMFVLPLQWLYFGEMSLMSIPATVILSGVCEAMLVLLLPYAFFAVAGWHYAAAIFAGLTTIFCRVCTLIADVLADYSPLISLRYPFTAPILILCIAVIVVMVAENVESWLYSLIPVTVAAAVFSACVGLHGVFMGDKAVINYINSGTNDTLAIVTHRKAFVLDFTSGSSNSMYAVTEALSKEYVTRIDTYILTDLSLRNINAFRSLLKSRVVDTVAVPITSDNNEVYLINSLWEIAEKYGTRMILYSRDDETEMNIGAISVTLPRYTELKRSSRPLAAALIECGDTSFAYVGSSAWESEYVWSFTEFADRIIIGEYGPVAKSTPGGHISPSVNTVYCHSSDAVSTLGGWLEDYDGEVVSRETVRIVVGP